MFTEIISVFNRRVCTKSAVQPLRYFVVVVFASADPMADPSKAAPAASAAETEADAMPYFTPLVEETFAEKFTRKFKADPLVSDARFPRDSCF